MVGSRPHELNNKRPRKRTRKGDIAVGRFLPNVKNTKLFVCGSGDFGQLGMGPDNLSLTKFQEVKLKEDLTITMVAAGGVHSLLLTDVGTVYSTGCNDDGPLGRQCLDENGVATDDDADFTFRPVEFNAEDMQVHGKIVMVTAGDCHSAALTEKGSVFVWGTFRGKDGEIGLMVDGASGEIMRKAIRPQLLMDHRTSMMVKISSGSDHLAMLDHEGSIWTIGSVTVGQLGRQRVTADKERGGPRILTRLLTPAVVNELGKRPKTAKFFPLHFKDVFSTAYSVFGLSVDDEVLCWGLNNYFQLGVQPTQSDRLFEPFPIYSEKLNADVQYKAFTGDQHILALSATGFVYGIGRGLDGRLGLGRSMEAEKDAAKVGPFSTSPVCGVTAAGSCSFAWTEDGNAFAWGFNLGGLLGLAVEEEAVSVCFNGTTGHRFIQHSVDWFHFSQWLLGNGSMKACFEQLFIERFYGCPLSAADFLLISK
uniref:Regulator of chromosome condensation n=1 Tax=Trichuris muris TaxID=70415 RepID=A0A5S6R2C1_TRIMR